MESLEYIIIQRILDIEQNQRAIISVLERLPVPLATMSDGVIPELMSKLEEVKHRLECEHFDPLKNMLDREDDDRQRG